MKMFVCLLGCDADCLCLCVSVNWYDDVSGVYRMLVLQQSRIINKLINVCLFSLPSLSVCLFRYPSEPTDRPATTHGKITVAN